MAKIKAFERHEYHIPADGNSPARDFVGFKIYIETPVDPEKGMGEKTTEYVVSVSNFPNIFYGHTAEEMPSLLGKEVLAEINYSGKKQVLTRVTLLEDFIKSMSKAATKA